MSKWQKISIVLAGLLVLSCVALAGVGVWWVASAGASNVLAAVTGQTPTNLPMAATTPAAPQNNPATAGQPQTRKAGSPSPVGTFGTVSSVSGNTITVTSARGDSRTLTVGSQTRIIVVGVTNATVSDIQTGDKILVMGVNRGSQALEPRAVIAAPGSYDRQNLKSGQVQAATASQLTLRMTAASLTTITLSSDTQFYDITLNPIRATDLASGTQVVVIGQAASDGTFDAQLVITAPLVVPGAGGRAAGGRAAKKGAVPAVTPTPGQ